MKALILAAGEGKKFHPFSYYRPKPLFPIANEPLMQYSLKSLVGEGNITDIGIVVGHREGRIRNHFGSGERFGCHITYIKQPQPLGTGDAVLRAKEFIGKDNFLVIYGDVYFPKKVVGKLKKAIDKTEVGVAVIEKRGADKGIAAEVKNGHISNYHWKDPHCRDFPAFSGIYGFSRKIWKYISFLPDITEETGNGIFPLEEKELASISKILSQHGNPLRIVEIEETIDMNFPWQPVEVYSKVVREMGKKLKETVLEKGARIERGAKIEGNIYLGKNAHIEENACIQGPVWIGENTKVLKGTDISSYTVIGKDSMIGPYSRISGSVGNRCKLTHCAEFSGIILDESYLVHYGELCGIFGERCEIGAGTMIGTRRFDDRVNKVIVNGIQYNTPGFSGVLLGDYSRTGVGAMIMPGRIVGPSAIVGSGVVLMKNVEPFTMVSVKQEQEIVPWKPDIYDK